VAISFECRSGSSQTVKTAKLSRFSLVITTLSRRSGKENNFPLCPGGTGYVRDVDKHAVRIGASGDTVVTTTHIVAGVSFQSDFDSSHNCPALLMLGQGCRVISAPVCDPKSMSYSPPSLPRGSPSDRSTPSIQPDWIEQPRYKILTFNIKS